MATLTTYFGSHTDFKSFHETAGRIQTVLQQAPLNQEPQPIKNKLTALYQVGDRLADFENGRGRDIDKIAKYFPLRKMIAYEDLCLIYGDTTQVEYLEVLDECFTAAEFRLFASAARLIRKDYIESTKDMQSRNIPDATYMCRIIEVQYEGDFKKFDDWYRSPAGNDFWKFVMPKSVLASLDAYQKQVEVLKSQAEYESARLLVEAAQKKFADAKKSLADIDSTAADDDSVSSLPVVRKHKK